MPVSVFGIIKGPGLPEDAGADRDDRVRGAELSYDDIEDSSRISEMLLAFLQIRCQSIILLKGRSGHEITYCLRLAAYHDGSARGIGLSRYQ
jgi:hypothetical protein